ncbi:MAG: regulatory protein SipA [Leptolyngbyaceae cyanobacterium]
MTDKLFTVGDRVTVTTQPPYLKTATPMPMLRPPDLVTLGEEGTVLEQKPGGYWAVRFERGSFLIDGRYIERVTD